VEDCVSLMIANVPVVVTALLRFGSDADRKSPPTQSILSTSMYFASRKLGLGYHRHEDETAASGTVLDIGRDIAVQDGNEVNTEAGFVAKERERRSKASSVTLTNGSFSFLSRMGTGTKRETKSEGSMKPILLDMISSDNEMSRTGTRKERIERDCSAGVYSAVDDHDTQWKNSRREVAFVGA
jgi:hypothetical protein